MLLQFGEIFTRGNDQKFFDLISGQYSGGPLETGIKKHVDHIKELFSVMEENGHGIAVFQKKHWTSQNQR